MTRNCTNNQNQNSFSQKKMGNFDSLRSICTVNRVNRFVNMLHIGEGSIDADVNRKQYGELQQNNSIGMVRNYLLGQGLNRFFGTGLAIRVLPDSHDGPKSPIKTGEVVVLSTSDPTTHKV